MRFLFFIQGEGRGHQTQALALHGILTAAGHEVVAAIVGTTDGRGIPPLLGDNLPVPMTEVPSPALIYSNRTRALDVRRTITQNVARIPRYWRGGRAIHDIVQRHRPDVLINFYEVACGAYHWLYQPGIPTVSVAHQYLMLHRQFRLPNTRWAHRALVNQVTRLTGIGTTRRLALSFYDFPDATAQRIFVVPPLLRADVRALQAEPGDFLLAYMTHHRLADDLIAWNQTHPDVPIRAFWDKKDATDPWAASPTLTFHQINAGLFLDAMRRCRGLVSTAGFESICEAMWLGKPVMMLPVPGHFEQACNAFDAERAGAGLRATSFLELDRFLDYLPRHRAGQDTFRAWQDQTAPRFLQHLTDVADDAPAKLPRLIRWSGRWLRRIV
jgi:uncharacterized protein (TIGR00661 family)